MLERITKSLFACVTVWSLAATASAQPVADFYKGKTIRLVMSSAEGGGYDNYARAIIPHLQNYLPGNPTIVTQQVRGAGGLVAANNLYNTLPRDGTVFAMIQRAAISTSALFSRENVRFDPTKFSWIGSMNDEKSVCAVWHTAPVKTFAEIQKAELIVGASGRGTASDAYANFLNNLFGTKMKIVTGYNSGTAIELAMERGEVSGRCSWSWSSLMSTKASWVAEKKVIPFVQLNLTKHPDLPDVPLITDFVTSDEQRQMIEVVFAPQLLGRPLLMPPEVPQDRLMAFRTAFNASMKDPKFVADAEAQNMDVTTVTGEQIQEMLDRLFKTPPDIVEKASQALEYR